MTKARPKPSIRQLAKRTGLSTATVSQVLRNTGRVSAETRSKVLACARKLNYVVNAQVSELMAAIRRQSPQNSEVIGLVSLYPHPRPWEKHLHLREIQAGATRRAEELGYRLEPFWILDPSQRPDRLRHILQTRSIRGLMCLGADRMDAKWPANLSDFAIVTVGLSIATPLHRVASNASLNAATMFRQLHARGYKRPGLLLHRSGDERNGHVYAAIFLYFCRYVFSQSADRLLYMEEFDAARFDEWFMEQKPDVLVFYHHETFLEPVRRYLKAKKLSAEVGLGGLDGVLPPGALAGVRQDMQSFGTRSIEMLSSLLHGTDFGIPAKPRFEAVLGQWVEGRTLRAPE